VVSALRSSPCKTKINVESRILQRTTTNSRVTLLGLLSIPREDNQLGLVGFQPFDIQFFALLAQVPPSVVNDNTNAACLFPVDTNLLQLSKGEATTFSDLAVVADSLGTDGRTEESEWADTKGSSLGLASGASA
jgi:hypothetical protein